MSFNLPAHAQAVRFIGSTGNDTNNCTRQAPCLTLQRGIDETPDRGVLQVLDGGAYGAGTIIRSITVLGDGVSAMAGRITINSATARVVLRGLLLIGPAGGIGAGLTISAARSVHVVRCEIALFGGHGI